MYYIWQTLFFNRELLFTILFDTRYNFRSREYLSGTTDLLQIQRKIKDFSQLRTLSDRYTYSEETLFDSGRLCSLNILSSTHSSTSLFRLSYLVRIPIVSRREESIISHGKTEENLGQQSFLFHKVIVGFIYFCLRLSKGLPLDRPTHKTEETREFSRRRTVSLITSRDRNRILSARTLSTILTHLCSLSRKVL